MAAENYIINVLLRGRDELAGVMDRQLRKFDDMIGASHRLDGKMRDLNSRMNALRSTTREHARDQDAAAGRVRGHYQQIDILDDKIKKLSKSMDTLSKKKAIGEKTEGDLKRIDSALKGFQTRLDNLNKSRTQLTVEIKNETEIDRYIDKLNRHVAAKVRTEADFDTTKATAEMEVFKAKLRELGMNDIDIGVEVQSAFARAELRALEAQARDTRNELDRLGHDGTRLGSVFHGVGGSVASFDNELRGMAVLAVFAMLQQLMAVLVALGGQLVAVASSALMAGGALAGGLAAGAAQAIPVIGLLAAALARVGSVMDAVKEAQNLQKQAATQATQQADQQRNAAERVRSAQEGVVSAENRLADAHRNVADRQRNVTLAVERLREARRDATRELQDLVFAEREAELAARGAALSQTEAQEALRRNLTQGRTGDLAQSRLRVDETALRTQRAGVEAGRARADASRGRRGGVEGTETVRNAQRAVQEAQRGVAEAQRGVADAERAVARARRGVAEARRDAARATEASLSAARNLNYLLSQLSPAEKRLYAAIRRIQADYKRLIRPITDIIIDAFARTVDRVNSVMRDPRLLGAFRGLAGEMAGSIDKISKAFTDDRSVKQFSFFAREAGANLKRMTPGIISFGRAFLNIGQAASPALRAIIDIFNDIAKAIEKSSRNRKGWTEFFTQGVRHLRAWLDLGWAVIKLIAAIMAPGGDFSKGASESGLRTTKRMTEGIEEFTEKINKNGDKVHKFFKRTEEIMGQVWRVVKSLGKAFMDAFNQADVKPLADLFVKVLIPGFMAAVRGIGLFVTWMAKLLTLPGVATIAKIGVTVLVLSRAMFGAAKAFQFFWQLVRPVVIVFGRLLMQTGGLRGAFGALRVATMGLLGPWGLLAGAVVLILAKLGLLDDLFRQFKKIGKQILNDLGKPLGELAREFGFTGDGAEALNKALEATRPIFKWIIEHVVPLLGTGFRIAFTPAIIAIKTLTGMIRALKQIISGIKDIFVGVARGDWGMVFGGFKKIGKGILDGILAPIRGLWAGIKHVFNATLDGLKSLLGISSPSTVFKDIGQNLVDGLLWPFKKLGELFKKIFEAALNPVKLLKGIKDKIGDALGGIGDFLGIGGDKKTDKGLTQEAKAKPPARRENTELKANVKLNTGQAKESMERLRQQLRSLFLAMWGSLNGIARTQSVVLAKTFERLANAVINSIDRMATRVKNEFHQMEKSMKQRATNAFLGVRGSMQALEKVVYDSMVYIYMTANKSLKAFDVDPIKLVLERPKSGGGGERRAATGYIGHPGERGRDAVTALVGRGEVVLNWAQQKAVNAAMVGQETVQNVVGRVRGYHAGTQDEATGYAGGGMVRIPGDPNRTGGRDKVAAGIANTVGQWVQKYRAEVGYGYDPGGGHVSPGHNRTGTATDVYPDPARGGTWSMLESGLRYLIRKGLKVLYGTDGIGIPWPNHGRGNHAHIEWGGKGVAISGAGFDEIKQQKVSGTDTPFKDMAQKIIKKVTDAANEKVSSMMGDMGGMPTPGAPGKGSLSAEQVRKIFTQAFQEALPYKRWNKMQPGWLNNLMSLAREESTWRPGAENKTAAGVAAGGPKGILQVIGATFRSYMKQGFGDIWNPLHNAIASIRYQLARYGTIKAHAPYATGGEIPGGEGQPVPILAHAKEWVLNRSQQSKVAALAGVSRDKLRGLLGFTGGPSSYAGGGEVIADYNRWFKSGDNGTRIIDDKEWDKLLLQFSDRAMKQMLKRLDKEVRQIGRGGVTAGERTRLKWLEEFRGKALEALLDLPNVMPIDVSGIMVYVRRFSMGVNRLDKKSKDYFEKLNEGLTGITKEGGLLDQLNTAMELHSQTLTTKLLRGIYHKLTKSSILARRLSESQVMEKELNNLLSAARDLYEGRGTIVSGFRRTRGAMEEIDKRIKTLRRGGTTKDEVKEIEALTKAQEDLGANRRNFQTRLREIDQKIAENIAARFEAQRAIFERETATATRSGEQVSRFTELIQRVQAAFGRATAESTAELNQARIDQMRASLAYLSERQAEASRRGYEDMANSLQDQIGDLWGSINEAVASRLNDLITGTVEEFARQSSRIDLGNRIADVFGAISLGRLIPGLDVPGVGRIAATTRRAVFDARANNMRGESDALVGLLGQARDQNNEGAVRVLTDRLTELAIAIEENSRQLFQARVEEANRIAQQATSYNSTMASIVEVQATLGLITGEESKNRQVALAEATGAALREQGTALATLYAEAVARGDEAQTVELNQAIAENTLAQLQNTQSVQELNGTLGQSQSVNSTAWTWFRQAILTGNGGLMPQYDIPSLNGGGRIVRDGVAYLHAAEVVRPAGGGAGDNVDFNLNITSPTEVADPTYLGNRLMWEYQQRGRR